MFYEVLPTKVFRADGGILTYSSEQKLQPGHLVSIPLGRQTVTGVVYRKVKKPDFPTKPITKLLYEQPLPTHLVKSALWLSDYYLCPLPLTTNLLLPTGVEKADEGRSAIAFEGHTERGERDVAVLCESVSRTAYEPSERAKPVTTGLSERARTKNSNIPLNQHQLTALKALSSLSSPTRLLHGITGSGKTNIYLRLIADTIGQQKSAILLVPEISLTSQLVQAAEQTFPGQVTLIHSQQAPKTRRLTWQKLLHSTTPQVIIGPRSALLAPIHNLGLIIIDEAHEQAYFQESPPKYSALRLASFIAQSQHIPCIQGTATPLAQDYYLAQQNHALVELKEKAKDTATPPQITLIDLKDKSNFTTNRYFSNQLIKQIENNLKNHHQTLIFHNRRGSAPLTLCENCGWQALCPTCYLPLTLHTDTYQLLCHTCGYQTTVPTSCPECHHPDIIHKGFGTKLLENELKKLFKDANVKRYDADNHKADALHTNYQAVQKGQVDIIIGTQTIAKGLDLPHLATVAVVQADAGLSLPDYSAEERTYHLLTQVIGRVGRGHLAETSVILQSFQPEHPIIRAAIQNDYRAFITHLLATRQKGHFPPFQYLAKLTVTYKTERTTLSKINSYRTQLSRVPRLKTSLPTPAFHEQSPRGYTWQLILSSSSRQTIIQAIKSLPKDPGLHFTLDPPTLL